MDQDKMRGEFLRIITQEPEEYGRALAKIQSHGSDFTFYSCTMDIIEKLNKTEDVEEIIELINESNSSEVYIHDIEKRAKRVKVDAVENFFQVIDDPETKERLFIMMGETGVGKSYMIEDRYPNIPQYACNQMLDPYTLCYHMDDKGKGLAPHETPFLKAVKEGGMIFLDEMNELPHDTLMLLQGITDEKKSMVIGDQSIEIHPNFKLIAALNPPSETDERVPLGDALLSRAVGVVLELTDALLVKRLGVSMEWLKDVRKLFNHVRQSGMIDVRDLSYRDYAKMSKYDFETQFKFKVCMGDLSNLRAFSKLQETGEYQLLLEEVLSHERL